MSHKLWDFLNSTYRLEIVQAWIKGCKVEKHKILCLFSFSNVRCLFCATLFRSGLKYSFEKISFTRKSFFICQSPFSRNTHFGSIVGVVLFPHNNYYVYYIDYIYISLRILLHFGSIWIYQVVLFPQNNYYIITNIITFWINRNIPGRVIPSK